MPPVGTDMISSSIILKAADGSADPAISGLDTYPIGEVLRSSQKFLDALALFSHSSRNSGASSPSAWSSEDSEYENEDLASIDNNAPLLFSKSGSSTGSDDAALPISPLSSVIHV